MEKHIILIMGYPASGKTLTAKTFQDKGFIRLNRDDLGGSLDSLVNKVDKLYSEDNTSKFVLDNTYSTSKSRKSIIRWARKNGFTIDCIWIDLDIGDALYNAAKRIIDKKGKLLMPDEIKANKDPSIYPPVVIYRARKQFEAPSTSEGFSKVEKVEFNRIFDPSIFKNRAIFLDYDGTLRKTKSGAKYPKNPNDILILPNRTAVLKKYEEQGYILIGVSNQSFVSKKMITNEQAIACFERTNELLGINIEYHYCPHPAFPQICYCRKPMPGIGVEMIEKYKLNPSKCIMVGDMTTDKTFANRCGFNFIDQKKFFKKTKEKRTLHSFLE